MNCFDHNFARSARIEPSFCTLAKLEELNNFYLDCFESYITKNASFESPGYLARARARAHGPPPQGAGGPPARFAKVSKYFSLCARAHRFKKFLRARVRCVAADVLEAGLLWRPSAIKLYRSAHFPKQVFYFRP